MKGYHLEDFDNAEFLQKEPINPKFEIGQRVKNIRWNKYGNVAKIGRGETSNLYLVRYSPNYYATVYETWLKPVKGKDNVQDGTN